MQIHCHQSAHLFSNNVNESIITTVTVEHTVYRQFSGQHNLPISQHQYHHDLLHITWTRGPCCSLLSN